MLEHKVELLHDVNRFEEQLKGVDVLLAQGVRTFKALRLLLCAQACVCTSMRSQPRAARGR